MVHGIIQQKIDNLVMPSMTNQVPDLQPEAVIDFWFRDSNTRTLKTAEALNHQWFRGGAALDEAIRSQFYTAIEKALAGGFKDWECESEARLALIVILDQFTRQAFRGTVRAFVGDPRAIRLAKSGWDKGYFDTLPAMMQAAGLMPLQHSERLEDQQLSVARFTELAESVSLGQIKLFTRGAGSAQYRIAMRETSESRYDIMMLLRGRDKAG